MQRIIYHAITNYFITALILILTIIGLFFYCCYGFYCYCNFVNTPTTYVCRSPLFFQRDSMFVQQYTTTSCKLYTLGYEYYFRLVFDGFSEDFLLVVTTIGSICDVGIIVGTVISFTVFYLRTKKLSYQNVEVSVEKVELLVQDTRDMLVQTITNARVSQDKLLQVANYDQVKSKAYNEAHLDIIVQLNDLLKQNMELKEKVEALPEPAATESLQTLWTEALSISLDAIKINNQSQKIIDCCRALEYEEQVNIQRVRRFQNSRSGSRKRKQSLKKLVVKPQNQNSQQQQQSYRTVTIKKQNQY